MRGTCGGHRTIDGPPHTVTELQVFEILGQIIQPPQQRKWIAKDRERRMTQTRGHAQPGLLADLDQNAIVMALDINRQRGLPAGLCAMPCGDLDCELIDVPNDLGMQVAAVEFRHERLCNVLWFDAAVKDSSVHDLDYNLLCQRR